MLQQYFKIEICEFNSALQLHSRLLATFSLKGRHETCQCNFDSPLKDTFPALLNRRLDPKFIA